MSAVHLARIDPARNMRRFYRLDVQPDLSGNKTLTAVLSDQSGLLDAKQETGGTVSGADTITLTLIGGLNAINAELATLTYTGSTSATTDTINVATSDGRGGSDDHTIGVTINPPMVTGYTFTTIDDPLMAASTLPDVRTIALGINDSGEIVGYFEDGNGGNFANGVFYDSGTYITLNDPNGSTNTFAAGINSSGEIVGGAGNDGFLYSNGDYATIDFPGSSPTFAGAINDSGQIVGSYGNNDQEFIYSNGTFTTINNPLGTLNIARGINNEGQIVGYYVDSSGVQHGFLDTGGTYTTLSDPLAATLPSGGGTVALGINNKGQIVGYYVGGNGTDHGFLYSGGNYTTIDDPLGSGTELLGINDSGQIVGSYLAVTAGQVAWHGFLATPIVGTGGAAALHSI